MSEYKLAAEKALEELSRYDELYPSHYRVIDPLIKPSCELLTELGYITMHSCSGHTKISLNKGYHVYSKFPQYYVQVYILFVASKPVTQLEQAISFVNEKYSTGFYVRKTNDWNDITMRYVIETFLSKESKDSDFYDVNKSLYLGLKEYFKK